jgi:hypothetical protein
VEEIISLITKTWGIAGILLAAPFFAVWVLWRQNVSLSRELRKVVEGSKQELTAANDKASKIQEQRVTDAQAVTTKMMQVVSEQSALNKETNLVLDRVGDSLSVLSAVGTHKKG